MLSIQDRSRHGSRRTTALLNMEASLLRPVYAELRNYERAGIGLGVDGFARLAFEGACLIIALQESRKMVPFAVIVKVRPSHRPDFELESDISIKVRYIWTVLSNSPRNPMIQCTNSCHRY